MKYRKKPVVVEAERFHEDNTAKVKEFCPELVWVDSFNAFIKTREGNMAVSEGDWIIKGFTKEAGVHFWVNKPDYFKQAYELMEDQQTDWLALYQINEDTKGKNITGER